MLKTEKHSWLWICFVIALLAMPACTQDDDDDDDADDGDDDTDDDIDDDSDDDADDDSGDDDDSSDDDSGDDDSSDDDGPDYPNDDALRVNMLQAKGSHNSYHIQSGPITIPEYRYTHHPLNEELDAGVRQVELDIHWKADGIRVFHVPIIDRLTTCEYFVDCLTIIRDWSDAHPGHHPIMIFVEPKDDIDPVKWPGHAPEIEDEILSVWPVERIITPDEVRGDYATLREAIPAQGWPTLREARDRVIFHLNSGGEFRDSYLELHPNLSGALSFIDSSMEDDWAGVLVLNDPIGNNAAILEAVNAGFIVRSRADSCCENAINSDYTQFEAALAGGAHFLSTDFPIRDEQYDYAIDIPDGRPSRCNPLTAPEWCVAEDIEALSK